MKYIKGFESLYSATEDGFIFSHYSNKYLKAAYDKYGYLRVGLNKNNKKYSKLVHRLVLSSFEDNPMNKPQVNHIDGVKSNNKLSNLEWCTESENSIHAYSKGLRPLTVNQSRARRINMEKVNKNLTKEQREYINKMVSKSNSKKVINKNTKEIYDSVFSLSLLLGINYSTLKWRVRNNKCEYIYAIR